ncbi:hypothetical protein DFH29DRAFT_1067754, partial [Suillus ampliporus]
SAWETCISVTRGTSKHVVLLILLTIKAKGTCNEVQHQSKGCIKIGVHGYKLKRNSLVWPWASGVLQILSSDDEELYKPSLALPAEGPRGQGSQPYQETTITRKASARKWIDGTVLPA